MALVLNGSGEGTAFVHVAGQASRVCPAALVLTTCHWGCVRVALGRLEKGGSDGVPLTVGHLILTGA